ncbi:MAG: hypothetical protein WCJ62_09900 [Flavobacterium sp.]
MKYIKILVAVIICSSSNIFAQSFGPYEGNMRLSDTMNSFMMFAVPPGSVGLNNFGEASLQDANARDSMSQADSSYVYQQAQQLQYQNEITRAQVFFQKRQTNAYYRTLEEIQKREIKKLKQNKELTIENLNSLYNTGFKIP